VRGIGPAPNPPAVVRIRIELCRASSRGSSRLPRHIGRSAIPMRTWPTDRYGTLRSA